MAHSLSSRKRIRQNIKDRARNRARKVQIKAAVKAFDTALASGDRAKAGEALRAAAKKLDQVAAKGTIRKRTASRRRSRLQRRLNAATATAPAS